MTDAREVILDALARASDYDRTEALEEVADACLSALAAAGLSITETPDEWEWGVKRVVSVHRWASEEAVRDRVAEDPANTTVVRRRPAGPWEVAS